MTGRRKQGVKTMEKETTTKGKKAAPAAAAQNAEAHAPAVNTRQREFKKVNVEIIKMEEGDEVEGTLVGRTTSPWTDKQDGEVKELTRVHFTRDDGTKFIIFEDGGLRGALTNAMVKDGDYVKILKLAKTSIGQGRTVNQYDIFSSPSN
jgi:hypothetical protein